MYPFRDDNTYVRKLLVRGRHEDEVTRDPIERVVMDDPMCCTAIGPARRCDDGLCPHR